MDWVMFKQFNEHPETIDPKLIKQNEAGEVFVGYNESVGYVYVTEYLYIRASLRESILVNGNWTASPKLMTE